MSDNNSPFKPLSSGLSGSAHASVGSRPSAGRPSAGRPGMGRSSVPSRSSTMNRPGSTVLNSNATATPAALAFAKEQETKKEFAPAISTGFTPPVIEEQKEEKQEYSPFKPISKPKAPIKRSDSINAFKQAQEAAEEPEEKPIFTPKKEEPKGPAIGLFSEHALENLPKPDFAMNQEAARSKSIKARQSASELKFMPFDESQVQSFGNGAARPSLQDRINASNNSGFAFTPVSENKVSSPFARDEEETKSPFKPLKEKPAFTKPTYNKPEAQENPVFKSPFAPRRSDD